MRDTKGSPAMWRTALAVVVLALALAAPACSGEVHQFAMGVSRPGPERPLQRDAGTIKLRSGSLRADAENAQSLSTRATQAVQSATRALGRAPQYLYYLVHLPRRASYLDAQQLARAGFTAVQTIPENAMVVRCPVTRVNRLRAAAGADLITPIAPAQKLAPGLQAPSTQARGGADGRLVGLAAVVVRLFPGETPEPVAARFRALGINVVSIVPDRGAGAQLHMMSEAGPFPLIAANPAVQWVEQEPPLTAYNDILTGETAISGDPSPGLINAHTATHHGTRAVTGAGQVVGHIDTGVDRGDDGGGSFHEDLNGKVSGAGLAGRSFGIFFDDTAYTGNWNMGQGYRDALAFTSNWTGRVNDITLILGRSGSALGGYIVLRLYTSSGGAPGTLLLNSTSRELPGSSMPSGTNYYTFTWGTSKPNLTRGTQYCLELDYSNLTGLQGMNNWFWYGADASAPATGYRWNGSAWASIAIYHWFRLINDGSTGHWLDLMGHGTHTAGTICGAGQDLATRRGVAYDATLVHRAAGTGSGSGISIPDLFGALTDMHNAGARIYSNSWGGGTSGQYSSMAVDVDHFMWDNPTDLVCFSAGNSGADAGANGKIDANSIGPPGTAKNCLTVGNAETYRTSPLYAWSRPTNAPFSGSYCTLQTGQYATPGFGQGLCPSSSRGTAADGRLKPEVVSPGWLYSCRSAYDNVTDGMPTDGTWPGGGYRVMNGTSMACPGAAGAAALVRQYLVDYSGASNPSAALIKAVMIAGADNLTPGQYGTDAYKELYDNAAQTGSPDYAQGYGRINVAKSLGMLDSLDRDFFQSVVPFTSTTTARYVTLRAVSSTPLSAVLAWTDYPGSALASNPLVNDLDLQIRTGYTGAKGSGTLVGQCLRPINEQTGTDPGQGDDSVNTEEKVAIGDPTPGTYYTFEVTCKTLGYSGQNFALVVTGDFDQPLPVVVEDFEGTLAGREASVRWKLAAGMDFVGCHVYRAQSPQGPFERVNSRLVIPVGGEYRFVDAGLPAGRTQAYYRIVGVRSNGELDEQDIAPYAVGRQGS